MLPSRVCNSASSWARSSESGGTASSASTVQPSGVTSARPLATKMRSAIPLPSYMSIVPGRIVEISGACPGRTPKLPSVPGTTTISTSRETSSCSGVTNSNWTGIRPSRRLGGHAAGFLDGLLDRADHVERCFRHLVVIAGDDALEALDRVFEVDEHAWGAGKD